MLSRKIFKKTSNRQPLAYFSPKLTIFLKLVYQLSEIWYTIKVNVGELIREYRTRRNWTQSELAFELDVSKGYISNIENDSKSLSLNQLLKFASVLDIPSTEIDKVRDKERNKEASNGEFEELLKAKENLERFLSERGMKGSTSTVYMLPVVGKIPAGRAVITFEDAYQQAETQIPVQKSQVKHSRCFFLKVFGDSMIDVGINEGDLVLIDPDDREIGGRGRVMAVLVNDEVTLKTVLRLTETLIRLVPENSRYAYRDIDAGAERVRIIGAVQPFMIRMNEKIR